MSWLGGREEGAFRKERRKEGSMEVWKQGRKERRKNEDSLRDRSKEKPNDLPRSSRLRDTARGLHVSKYPYLHPHGHGFRLIIVSDGLIRGCMNGLAQFLVSNHGLEDACNDK